MKCVRRAGWRLHDGRVELKLTDRQDDSLTIQRRSIMGRVTVRRARLITDKMRQAANFCAAMRQIDSALAIRHDRYAKKLIRSLVQKLLRHPSEETVEYFVELQRHCG